MCCVKVCTLLSLNVFLNVSKHFYVHIQNIKYVCTIHQKFIRTLAVKIQPKMLWFICIIKILSFSKILYTIYLNVVDCSKFIVIIIIIFIIIIIIYFWKCAKDSRQVKKLFFNIIQRRWLLHPIKYQAWLNNWRWKKTE